MRTIKRTFKKQAEGLLREVCWFRGCLAAEEPGAQGQEYKTGKETLAARPGVTISSMRQIADLDFMQLT